MKSKIRVTLFLIVNPIIIIWAINALVVLLNRDGMAVIMSGFFIGVIATSSILLFIDRLLVHRINIWVLTAFEILILFTGLILINSYN